MPEVVSDLKHVPCLTVQVSARLRSLLQTQEES